MNANQFSATGDVSSGGAGHKCQSRFTGGGGGGGADCGGTGSVARAMTLSTSWMPSCVIAMRKTLSACYWCGDSGSRAHSMILQDAALIGRVITEAQFGQSINQSSTF